jgi:hypothetical protein
MPIPNDLSPELLALLQGTPWGTVYPGRPNPPPLAVDGRTVALRILRKYLSEVQYVREGDRLPDGRRGAPIQFRVPESNIFIGWPDYEATMDFPTITILHAPGNYNPIGLANYVEEHTRDKYGRGTVVSWMSEYEEDIILELWAGKKPELRALLAGIETVLSPTELMSGVRFRMPDYFDELVVFSAGTRQEFDEADSARNRRRARLEVNMRFTVVALVNYAAAVPELKVVVDGDLDYNTAVTAEEVAPQEPTKLGPCDPCG